MEGPKRIVVICKRDILLRFWKITLEPGQVYPEEETILKVMRFLHNRSKYGEFELYGENAYFEVWNKDCYREIDYTNITNVQGRNWPKKFNMVTLFPMADIKDTADLMKYNRWRKMTFTHYIQALQRDYVWERSDGVKVLSNYGAGWMKVDPEKDIHILNPPELLDCVPEEIKNFITKKLNGL
jgi:hypothetical protein